MNKLILITLLAFSSVAQADQTSEFRHFLREFFTSEKYQIESIKFPVAYSYYEVENDINEKLVTKHIKKSEWEHLYGHKSFHCEVNCMDLVIYDNFKKEHKESNKRVLSFEGYKNGINMAYYFEKIDGSWYLVKYERFSN